MLLSSIKYAGLAATTLLSLVTADPKQEILNAASTIEYIILANCINPQNSADLSSYVAYFPSNLVKTPSAFAKVQTPWGHTAWWEGGTPISATFPDKDVFSANIPNVITINNAFVGLGKNNFGPFSIWRQWNPDYFTAPDGAVCSGIYICNHNPPPANEIEVHITIGTSSVVFDGDINPWDVFHTVWNVRDATSCRTNAQSIPGTSCSIVYNCYGATDWLVTNGMASAFNDVVSKSVKRLETYTTRSCVDVNDITRKCDEWENIKNYRSYFMSHGRIDVTNQSPSGSGIPNSYAGWMTYDISCPASSTSCAGCKAAEVTLQGGAAAGTASLNPEIAGAFGAADVLTTVFCDLIGC